MNGALAQADVLGIFGREGLDMALLWEPPTLTQPGAYACACAWTTAGPAKRSGKPACKP